MRTGRKCGICAFLLLYALSAAGVYGVKTHYVPEAEPAVEETAVDTEDDTGVEDTEEAAGEEAEAEEEETEAVEEVEEEEPAAEAAETETVEEAEGAAVVEAAAENTGSSVWPFYETEEGTYNYCPSVLQTDGGTYVYYCKNTEGYQIRDSIYVRKIEETAGGYTYWSDSAAVTPSAGSGWDSYHVCDPSVIEGSFAYDGTSYKYLMTYLGTDRSDSQNNQIGLAVSNSPDSGWVKVTAGAPLISNPYELNGSAFQWGVGQASLLSLGDGRAAVLYTQGGDGETVEMCRIYDLSNLNAPALEVSFTVSCGGMGGDYISNADFAFSDGYIYMVCDVHPFPDGVLDIVAAESAVYRTKADKISDLAGCEWELVSVIGEGQTGYGRNHNAGFWRSGAGDLAKNVLFVTTATEGRTFAESLYSYRVMVVAVG